MVRKKIGMKNLIKTPRNIAFSLFVIALMVRVTILICFDHNKIHGDSLSYHGITVNLVNGNGYSVQKEEPYEKWYFREPGYPVFLAGIYSVVNIFHPVQYIEGWNKETWQLDKYYPEIIVAKTIQVILDSISIVLLFFILLKIANLKIAFLTALLTSLFFNLAFTSVYILRETLVIFFLLVLNTFYLKYIFDKHKYFWLLLMGISVGLLILIFQVHVVIFPVLFILILIHTKKFTKSVFHTSFATIVAIFITLPFSLHVYSHYPDIGIFKTFGTSYTHELHKYTNANRKLEYYGILTQDEMKARRAEWRKNSTEQFQKSFNGYYSTKADSLNSLAPSEPFISKRKVDKFIRNFRKSFFLTQIGFYGGFEIIEKYGYIILVPLVIFPGLIGVLGIIGLLFYWKRYVKYFLPFLVYLSIFWIIGDSYRRLIIFQPFLIFFALLFINRILEARGFNFLANINTELSGSN